MSTGHRWGSALPPAGLHRRTSPRRPPAGAHPRCSPRAPMCCTWRPRGRTGRHCLERAKGRATFSRGALCCLSVQGQRGRKDPPSERRGCGLHGATYFCDQPFHFTRYSMRPCRRKRQKTAGGRGRAPGAQPESHAQTHAPNARSRGIPAAQSARTGLHPAPRPPRMQASPPVRGEAPGLAAATAGTWGKGAGPAAEARPRRGPSAPGTPTFRMRRLRRASAANTRSPTAESSMLTRRFPPRPLPGAEKQQPAHDSP